MMNFSPLRVLVVDDDEDDFLIIRDLLGDVRHGDYRLEWVSNLDQGLQALRAGLHDVYLVDYQLGPDSGMELLKAASDEGLQRTIIVLTGHGSLEIDQAAMAAGAADYLVKGQMQPDLLARSLRYAVDHSRQVAEIEGGKQRYQLLFDQSPVSAWVMDRDTARMVAVNEAMVSSFGYSREELLSMTVYGLCSASDQDRVWRFLDDWRDGQGRTGVWEQQRKDGSRLWSEITSHDLMFGDMPGRMIIASDITERMQADQVQAALYKISDATQMADDLNDLFRRIHESIGELLPARNFYVALYDRITDEVSFPYFVDEQETAPLTQKLSQSAGLTDFVIRTGEPLLTSPESNLFLASPEHVQSLGPVSVDWLGIPLKTQQGTIGVLAVQTYSGLVRYSERDKELLQFVSGQVAAAIERKQVEQITRENEEKFHGVFDKSPIYITLKTLPEGRFVEMNQACLDAFGYKREEIIGSTSEKYAAWVDPTERERYINLIQEHGSVRNFEVVMRRQNGEQIVVLASGTKIMLGGQPYSLNSLQDITESKRAEESLRRSETKFRTLYESTGDAVMLLNDRGFADCNLATVALFGCASVEDFCNYHPADLSPPTQPSGTDSRTLAEKQIAIAIASGRNRFEWIHKRADTGVTFPAEVVLNAMVLDGQPVLQGVVRDITERTRQQEAQRLAKVVFEHNVEGIMVTADDGLILMVNPAFEQLTGFAAAEVVGNTPQILDSGHHDAAFFELIQSAVSNQGYWKGEIWSRKKTGEIFPMLMSVATVHNTAGQPTHTISIMADISAQKVQAARIEQLAFYDSLTGLPNRALFLDRLEQTLAAAERHGQRGAILFLDLDRFKEINDSQGHAVGDMALAEVARRFLSAARKEETMARLGGDEFVLIAEGADQQAAALIAMRMQQALVEPVVLNGHPFNLGASIGIAFYPEDGLNSGDLIKHTDIAMYRAKASGGGYRFYQAEMGAELEKQLSLAKKLNQAMDSGILQLYYQPQIELATGKLVGAEALLRWNDSEWGWVSPSEFIPIAEDRGMMGPLGEWVLRAACRQLCAWQSAGLHLNGRLAINVSAQQMEDPEIVGRLLSLINDAGLSPHAFELELTESSMMVEPERAIVTMQELRECGFGLSIDDFGTGYSSLAYLKRFAASQVKIDISFVRNMLTDQNDYAIVSTIIAMARTLGLKTTAEGVEEAGQGIALLSQGCDYAQGYHYGRPEPADVFAQKWLMLKAVQSQSLVT